jgi:hypothetical protein
MTFAHKTNTNMMINDVSCHSKFFSQHLDEKRRRIHFVMTASLNGANKKTPVRSVRKNSNMWRRFLR